MTLLVGGLDSVRDELLAAALRGKGVDATPLRTPDAAALATGHALLARGHCSPTYLLAGALVNHARAMGKQLSGYITAGTCGPCRYATYPNEFRRAFAAAGLAHMPGAALDVVSPEPTHELASLGVEVTAPLVRALARAAIVGDAVIRAGCTHRPFAAEPDAVDALVAARLPQLTATLARGSGVMPALRELGRQLAALPTAARSRAPVRVRVTGQLFASITDGHGGFDLIRWFEARGAVVEPPAIAEWLVYVLWAARTESPYRTADPPHADAAEAAAQATSHARRARALEAAVHATYARFAAALHARPFAIAASDDLAELARPHYPPALRGGLGHLEVAELLRAERDRSADLVVSIKPFGCLPSSAISDGIARSVAARSSRVVFAAIETSGEGHTLAASRLELALDRARAIADR